jgi:hypothetical protein
VDYLPVPVRLDVCGLPLALSETLSVPVRFPVAEGVNTTLMLQGALAPRLAVQFVVETLKSPVVEIEIPVSNTACSLVSVNTFAGLLVPTLSIGKFAVTGVNLA